MVHVTLFKKSLKLTYINKILYIKKTPWLTMLIDAVDNLSRLKSFGSVWCKNIEEMQPLLE